MVYARIGKARLLTCGATPDDVPSCRIWRVRSGMMSPPGGRDARSTSTHAGADRERRGYGRRAGAGGGLAGERADRLGSRPGGAGMVVSWPCQVLVRPRGPAG